MNEVHLIIHHKANHVLIFDHVTFHSAMLNTSKFLQMGACGTKQVDFSP